MTKDEKLFLECSIEGFINDFRSSQFKSTTDIIDNALAYILKYNMHLDYTKCDIKELVFTAKNEVAKAIAKRQLESDPKNLNDMHSEKDNEEVKQFLLNPIRYIYEKFKDEDYVEHIHYDDPKRNPEERRWYDESCRVTARQYTQLVDYDKLEKNYLEYENSVTRTQLFTTQLCAKLSLKDNTISASFEKQKSGYFEKMFKTTSPEYESFKQAYSDFNNKYNPLYGNAGALKFFAMNYLKHKFPNLKDGELPTEKQIASLSGAGKERASFCLSVVEKYNENHLLQEQANKITQNFNPNFLKQDKVEVEQDIINPLYKEVDSLEHDVDDESMEYSDDDISQDNEYSVDEELENS
jgi:hypothetical protein